MSTIDAILPLTLADVERARILLRSLAYLEALGTLWIVVPDHQQRVIEDVLPPGPHTVVPESRLLPELSAYRSWYRFHRHRSRRRIDGWYVQQLIKLAAASIVRTPFYLTLDADVICLKPVRYDDLIKDGRAIHKRLARNLHAEWYQWAERVLGVRRSGLEHGVTPAILSRDAMRALHLHLESRVGFLLRCVAHVWPEGSAKREALRGWRGYLIRHLPFTEYAIYATFLEALGLYDRYHVEVGEHAIYDHCVWFLEDFERWEPARLMETPGAWFCVVQSNTGIDPKRVAERVEPLMPGAANGRNIPA